MTTPNAPPTELAEILRMMVEVRDRSTANTVRQLGQDGEQAVRNAIPVVRDLRAALMLMLARSTQAKATAELRLENLHQNLKERAKRSKKQLDRDVEELRRRATSKTQLEKVASFRREHEELIRIHRRHLEEARILEEKRLKLRLKETEVHSEFATGTLKVLDDLGKGTRPQGPLIRKGALAAVGIAVGVYNAWFGVAFALAELLREILANELKQSEKFIAKLENRIKDLQSFTQSLPQLTTIVRAIASSLV